MCWPGESPPVSMSPLVNPIGTSLTSGEGDVRVPPCMRRPFVDAWRDVVCGCGLGRVPKRSSAEGGVLMEFEASHGGTRHEQSPVRASMSLTVRDGTVRFE